MRAGPGLVLSISPASADWIHSSGDLGRGLGSSPTEDPTLRKPLDARPGVVYADVVDVLDLVLAAGFEELTFVGSRH